MKRQDDRLNEPPFLPVCTAHTHIHTHTPHFIRRLQDILKYLTGAKIPSLDYRVFEITS